MLCVDEEKNNEILVVRKIEKLLNEFTNNEELRERAKIAYNEMVKPEDDKEEQNQIEDDVYLLLRVLNT